MIEPCVGLGRRTFAPLFGPIVPIALTVLATCSPRLVQATPKITTASYLGGSESENVLAGRILSDGSVIVAGSASPGFGSAAAHNIGSGGAGFIAKFDATGTKLVWVARLEEEVQDCKVDGADDIYALEGSQVLKLDPSGSTVLASSAKFSGGTALALGGDVVGVIAGGMALAMSAKDLKPIWMTDVGRSRVAGIAVDAMGHLYVGGDQNTNTGFETYRSPYLFHYDSTGKQDAKLFDWPGPAVRENGLMLQADSRIDSLFLDPSGQLWFAGGSDGGNTVLVHKAADLSADQPALAGACYSGPCFNYKGAKHTSMLASVKSDFSDLDRGSWYVPYYQPDSGKQSGPGVMNPPCGCKGPPLSPNTLVLSTILFNGTDVLIAGNAAARIPETADTWFPMGDGSSFVAILDHELKTAHFSTTIPGTAGGVTANLPRGDARGGRLLLVGNAIAPSQADPGSAFPQVNFPATSGAFQPTFGGGDRDGYLLIACLGSDAECAAPPPPLAGAAGASAGGASPGAAGTPSSQGGSPASSGGVGGGSAVPSGGALPPHSETSTAGGCGCRFSRVNFGSALGWLGALGGLLALRRRGSHG